MKKLKRMAVVLAAAMSLLVTGCAQEFDAKGYVQGDLDAVLKGEISEDFLKLVDSTEEEILAENEKLMDENMAVFEDLGLSDEMVEKYRGYMTELMKKCKYTVGEAVKTDEGYTVTVTVEPILFGDALEGALTSAETDLINWITEVAASEEVPTEEEILEKTYDILYTYLNDGLDEIGYGEGVAYDLHVVKDDNNMYTVVEDDVLALGEGIIDPGQMQ